MDENKFTPTAEEALQLAQEAAGELGHGYMGTEHLLLGLMREDEGLAHTVLTEAGLTNDLLTEMIRKSAGTGLSGSNSAQSLSPRAKHVLEIAMEDAARRSPGDLAVVAHGGIIALFLERVTGRWYKPRYCEVISLVWDDSGFYQQEETP